MALTRRSSQRMNGSIWPGFVDAMTALLLVLMFVLTIFMIVQFMQRETITEQDTELDELSAQVAGLAQALGLEKIRSADLSAQVSTLDGQLSTEQSVTAQQRNIINLLTTQSEEQTQRIASFEERVASLLAENTDAQSRIGNLVALNTQANADLVSLQTEQGALQEQNAGLIAKIEDIENANARLITDQEALNLALAQARDEIDAGLEAARLDAAKREALQALIADLQSEATVQETSMQAALAQLQAQQSSAQSLGSEVSDLKGRVSDLEALLAAEQQNRAVEVAALGSKLTDAERQLAIYAASLTEEEKKSADAAATAAALGTEMSAAQERLAALAADLNASEQLQLTTAAAVEALRTKLAESDALLTASTTKLSDEEQARLASLAAADALQRNLSETQSKLTDAEERAAAEAILTAALRERLATTEVKLSAEEQARLAENALTKKLRADLAVAEAKLTKDEQQRLAEAAAAEALRQRLAESGTALDAAETARLAEAAAAQALRKRLENADTELTAMTLSLEAQRKKAEETLTLLAAARAVGSDLDVKLAAALAEAAQASRQLAATSNSLDKATQTMAELAAENEALRATLGESQTAINSRLAAALADKLAAQNAQKTALSESQRRAALLSEAQTALRMEEAKSAESLRKLELLSQQTAELRQQVANLGALLDLANQADADKGTQITVLTNELNTALLRTASEQKKIAELEAAERKRLEAEAKKLEGFKSEFFGQLRQLLAGREGVQIVGDRFVFSSEVLFPSGGAELSAAGEEEIAKVANILADVIDKIPSDIDWVIRVDGHTDNVPLSGSGKYTNNWELSQGRALSVVQFMISAFGLPADRLSANGFGEYQPINTADTFEARAQNRRIELKLTEK